MALLMQLARNSCGFLKAAMTLNLRRSVMSMMLLACSFASRGQQTPSFAGQPAAGSNWDRVKVLPINTGVHMTTDHGGRTCRIFAVSEDGVTCAKGHGAAGLLVPRAEIKHIKLTHHVRSTLVGAGIGAGIGATAGAIAGRTKPCPTGGGLCLNGIGIGAGGVAAIFGVGGAVMGSVVGVTTDFARGSTIYARP